MTGEYGGREWGWGEMRGEYGGGSWWELVGEGREGEREGTT